MDENAENISLKKRSFKKTKIIASAVLLIVVFWWFYIGIPSSSPETCDSLAPDIVDLSADNASIISPKFLDIVEIKEVEPQGIDILRCHGIAILSNGMKQNVMYHSYVEYEKGWIEYKGLDAPFD